MACLGSCRPIGAVYGNLAIWRYMQGAGSFETGGEKPLFEKKEAWTKGDFSFSLSAPQIAHDCIIWLGCSQLHMLSTECAFSSSLRGGLGKSALNSHLQFEAMFWILVCEIFYAGTRVFWSISIYSGILLMRTWWEHSLPTHLLVTTNLCLCALLPTMW